MILARFTKSESDTVVTKKGVLDKDKFYLPKNLVETYDGHKLHFRVTKEEAQTYRIDKDITFYSIRNFFIF